MFMSFTKLHKYLSDFKNEELSGCFEKNTIL